MFKKIKWFLYDIYNVIIRTHKVYGIKDDKLYCITRRLTLKETFIYFVKIFKLDILDKDIKMI